MHPAEVWVREHSEWFRDRIEQATGKTLDDLHMRFETNLALMNGVGAVSESTTGVRFMEVPPRDGRQPTVIKITVAKAPTS